MATNNVEKFNKRIELENPPLKAALYERVSTDEQAKGQTIKSQASENEKYCKENSYEIHQHYQDDGWSGGSLARPELDRLLDDAKSGLFQIVVCNAIDRLARDEYGFAFLMRELEKMRIRIIFVKTPLEDDPMGKFVRGIFAHFATLERMIILERTRRGKRYKVEVRKEYIGCIPPYGYRYILRDKKNNESGHLEFNKEEKGIVEMMFRWVAYEGLSARDVVRRLTEMKIRTRKGKTVWSRSSVLRILKRECYIGKFSYNRMQCVETENHRKEERYRKNLKTGRRQRHPDEWIWLEKKKLRIVDDVTFEAVQNNLKKNAVYSKRNTKNQYLFQGGLMKCAKCRSSYHATSSKGKAYYVDGNKSKRFPLEKDCNSPIVTAEKVEKVVWETITKLFNSPRFLVSQVKAANESLGDIGKDPQELQVLKERLDALKKEEDRMISGYQKGIFTDEVKVKEILTGIRKDRESIKSKVAAIKANKKGIGKKVRVKDVRDLCSLVSRRIKKLTFEQRQFFLRQLVDEIVFDGKKLVIKGYIPTNFQKPEKAQKSHKNKEISRFNKIENPTLRDYVLLQLRS